MLLLKWSTIWCISINHWFYNISGCGSSCRCPTPRVAGHFIQVLETTTVTAKYDNQEEVLTMSGRQGRAKFDGQRLVTSGSRSTLARLTIKNKALNNCKTSQVPCQGASSLFGLHERCTSEVQTQSNTKPKFLKPRSVPYILKKKWKKWLWATPIFPW